MSFEVRNEQTEKVLNDIGRTLKAIMPPNFGFTLLLTSFGDDHDLFYISSCERESMIATMREFIAKHEPS